ncbi:hypothetical protein ACFL6S_20995 [Candidatus Poribacteria bacterium]
MMKALKGTAVFLIFLFILSFPSYMAFGQSEEARTEKGKLEIWFRITSTPMTEREIYYHVCRLYIDEAAAGESPFVNKESKWFRLFSVELEEGVYNAKVVHGYASSKGEWAGEFSKQPKIFRVGVKAGPTTRIKYSYNVDWRHEEYIYDKIPPPPPRSQERLNIPAKHKPRIMVIIPEQHLQRRHVPDPAAETEVIRRFVENDFWVVDQVQVGEIRYNDELKQALQGNNDTVAAIGRQFDAEVLVIGEAFSQFTGFAPGDLVQCIARVEARAIRVDTGQILASHGLTATASGVSEEIASKESLAEAGGKVGDYIAREIARKWTSSSAPSVRIKLNGVDFRQLILFEQMLKERLESVEDFHRRSFDVVGKIAEIDVDVKGGAQALSTELTTRKFPDFEIEVLNFSTNVLDLRLKPKAVMPSGLALAPKTLIFMERASPDGTEKIKHKVMVLEIDETRLEYDWAIESPDGSSRSGTYVIDKFDKSHDYGVDWGSKEETALSGTAPWVSREAFRELRDNGFTTITVDRHVRKDAIVIAELSGVTIFTVKVNGRETELKAIAVSTDKGDKLLILDELQNPLVLSAEVAGRYRSEVTAIYVPGYVEPRMPSLPLPQK